MRPQGSPAELERRRLRAIELLQRQLPVHVVAERLGVDRRSVRRWNHVENNVQYQRVHGNDGTAAEAPADPSTPGRTATRGVPPRPRPGAAGDDDPALRGSLRRRRNPCRGTTRDPGDDSVMRAFSAASRSPLVSAPTAGLSSGSGAWAWSTQPEAHHIALRSPGRVVGPPASPPSLGCGSLWAAHPCPCALAERLSGSVA